MKTRYFFIGDGVLQINKKVYKKNDLLPENLDDSDVKNWLKNGIISETPFEAVLNIEQRDKKSKEKISELEKENAELRNKISQLEKENLSKKDKDK